MSPARDRSGIRPALVVAALLVVLALAAGHAAPLAAQEQVHLTVEIHGVDGDAERNVRALLTLARAADAGTVTPYRIRRLDERAEHEIATALEPFGFFTPTVHRSLKEAGDRWTITYDITPGPAVRVRNLDLVVTGDGADAPIFQRTVADFPLRRGDTLRTLPYQQGKLAFLSVASDSGYLHGDFDSSAVLVDRRTATADIVLHFHTGPRYRFGPVRFEQSVLDPSFLRTRVPFRQGAPYRSDKLLELQTALGEDPYFNLVEVMPQPDSAVGLEVPIDVKLVPKKPVQYELGAGYGTDTGPRGRLSIAWRRLNRRGHHAEFDFTGASIEQTIQGRYIIPAVGTPRGSLDLFAGYGRLNPTTSSSRAIVAGARLSRTRLGWRETLSLAFHHEAFQVGLDTGTTNLVILGGSWDRTRANNQIFPSSGYRARFDIQGGKKGFLTDATFLQLEASGKLIHSLNPRTRILLRGDVGRIFTGSIRDLPATLRFFTGGAQTVRGFGYLALGPTDAAGNAIGGRTLEVASVEADYRVLDKWAVAAFTDVGGAVDALTLSVRQGALEQGVGAGVRWISPIGLIRADLAFPATRGWKPIHFHFSIGPDL